MAERDAFHHLWALIFTKLAEDRQLVNAMEDVSTGVAKQTDTEPDGKVKGKGKTTAMSAKSRPSTVPGQSSSSTAVPHPAPADHDDAAKAKQSVQSLRDEMRKLRARTKHTIHFAAALLMDPELTAMSRMIAAATNHEHLMYHRVTRSCRDPHE
eukprot:4002413-Amphidinium_carterae.1